MGEPGSPWGPESSVGARPGVWQGPCSQPLSPQAVCGHGSQEALALRPAREGDLYYPEDREVNLVELALATNIPKGCAETAVRGAAGRRAGWAGGREAGQDGAAQEDLTHLSALLPVHVSYLDGKGKLAPQGSGKGWSGPRQVTFHARARGWYP